jgi:hypothetical protein
MDNGREGAEEQSRGKLDYYWVMTAIQYYADT